MNNSVVVYGITGGIAAYKAPLVVRGLRALGIDVTVVMTESARQFVTPYTIQTISGNQVYTEMFSTVAASGFEIDHIALADRADCFLIAPATANFIAKLAHGIADDLLTTTALATRAPLLVCPSMNVNMLTNQATQDNLQTLQSRGIRILEPEAGELACGWEGQGRLPEPERIVAEVQHILSKKDFSGKNILITCGPTCEDIDPVRYITNRSTGKMGAALVEAACLRDARVTVISGPVHLKYAPWAEVIEVRSAREMLNQVNEHLVEADVLIMAAAVADFVPAQISERKIKKSGTGISSLDLAPSPDILSTLIPRKNAKIFIGFAAETESLLDNARQKMESKGLDMIVANQVGRKDTGFASDTNSGVILSPSGIMERFELIEKTDLAHKILDHVKDRL
ncbi:MAG: bifunctional phosphopantothenoylcysteine decarboxylase/phosphopantothenate--cysteine ligase CoaBC [Deltaproteobacteria bacterium]|nr:bifunctional phosphopantothenoylcysteine decarboxylase/phosphopantothenate--cysteine ligase CoaBC [Deltaproteobacteria bacterium]